MTRRLFPTLGRFLSTSEPGAIDAICLKLKISGDADGTMQATPIRYESLLPPTAMPHDGSAFLRRLP
jgi:hypothetical protein